VFWALYRKCALVRLPRSANTALSPSAAAEVWTATVSDPEVAAALASTVPPPSDEELLQVPPEALTRLIKLLPDSSPGPDGLPPLFTKHFVSTLVTPLAVATTQPVPLPRPPSNPPPLLIPSSVRPISPRLNSLHQWGRSLCFPWHQVSVVPVRRSIHYS